MNVSSVPSTPQRQKGRLGASGGRTGSGPGPGPGFTCRDVADGEQADARVPVHRPLLRLAVGLAAVVHEARVVPLGPRVDDPVLHQQSGGFRGGSSGTDACWAL